MPSFASTSSPVTVYVYNESSSTAITAVLDIVGASLVFATVMVNVCDPVSPASSVAVTVMLCVPTSPLAGVPVSLPVDGSNVSHDDEDGIVADSATLSPTSTSDAVTVYR